MAFLKAIDSHDRQFETVHNDIDDLKRLNNELQVIIRKMEQDIASLKDEKEERRKKSSGGFRMSLPRMIQGVRDRRNSASAGSRSSRGSS